MEPLSATASVLSLLDITLRTTSALVKYTQDARHASAERKLLADEALLLATILEKLRERVQSARLDDRLLEFLSGLVHQFQRAYDDLAAALKLDPSTGQPKHESRLSAAGATLKWSFSKSEVYSLLEKITRLQQLGNTLLLNNQQCV
jgi:hypothetical protein